jgi:hypothetical protein
MLTLRIGLLKILLIIIIAKIATLKSLNCNFSYKLKLEHSTDLPFSPPNAMFANANLIVRPHQLLAIRQGHKHTNTQMQRNDKKVLVDTYSFTGNEKACARSSIKSSKNST